MKQKLNVLKVQLRKVLTNLMHW